MSTMRGATCVCSSRRALQSFVWASSDSQAASTIGGQLLRRAHVPSSPTSTSTRPSHIRGSIRMYSRGGGVYRGNNRRGPQGNADRDPNDDRGFDKRFTTARDIQRSGRDRMPQDHEITDPQIMVMDNGVTEGPLATSFVMTKLEPGESLRMIEPYVPADPKAEPRPTPARFAVCKIVDKTDEYKRQQLAKERKKAAAATKVKTKELDLTWAIDEHDLATKMRQLGTFLEKGMKVELVIGRKRRGRKAEQAEMTTLVKKVREEADKYAGRETKPSTGTLGTSMRFFFEGKPPK